jgi:UDP-MurNAc hydroxylase
MVEHGDVTLICDPWVEGTAFNKGWSLLSETRMDYSEFDRVTHIWFSHEHPDHFSPPNLSRIPRETRAGITVLFQETTDRKVAEFCRGFGFKEIVELEEGRFHEIGEDFSILCNPYTYGDSYAVLKVGGINILNLNDCVVNSDKAAYDLKKRIGDVDLLFTQFGYANKIGNSVDKDLREQASKEKLERIRFQNRHLNPSLIVPFASYIYFCHEENRYMNEGMNRVDRIHAFIEDELKTRCMVMYPGDVWEPGIVWDSTPSIRKYMDDYERLGSGRFYSTETVDEGTLMANSRKFIDRLKDGYPAKTRVIESLHSRVFVTDHAKSYELSGTSGLKLASIGLESCDLSLSSESLNYCFKELWGGDTLYINARYQAGVNYDSFHAFSEIASNLNRKARFPIPTFTESLIARARSLPGRILRKAGFTD